MKNQRAAWGVLAAIGFIGVLPLAREFGPRPKARVQASRIADVNRVSSFSMVLASTKTPPGSQQSPNR
jgi:hypothetical protein